MSQLKVRKKRKSLDHDLPPSQLPPKQKVEIVPVHFRNYQTSNKAIYYQKDNVLYSKFKSMDICRMNLIMNTIITMLK